ncbi:MAG: hypothetical protein AAF791_04535 [Bacteroidota bacterium]
MPDSANDRTYLLLPEIVAYRKALDILADTRAQGFDSRTTLLLGRCHYTLMRGYVLREDALPLADILSRFGMPPGRLERLQEAGG